LLQRSSLLLSHLLSRCPWRYVVSMPWLNSLVAHTVAIPYRRKLWRTTRILETHISSIRRKSALVFCRISGSNYHDVGRDLYTETLLLKRLLLLHVKKIKYIALLEIVVPTGQIMFWAPEERCVSNPDNRCTWGLERGVRCTRRRSIDIQTVLKSLQVHMHD
jgi:hypothetical protein